MIKTSPKKCKGTGHAINQGCGQIQLLFKYGLCQQCFKQFLKTDKGLEVIQKYTIKASKLNSLKEKKQTIAENKQSSPTKPLIPGKAKDAIAPIVNRANTFGMAIPIPPNTLGNSFLLE